MNAIRVLLLAMLVAGCSAENSVFQLQELNSPAGSGSSLPNLVTAADGRAFLSWVEPDLAGGHALRFSVLEQSTWSAARTISRGDDWFVNWADFPSMTVLNDGTLAAHWLRKSGEDTYAYHIELAFSADGGESWQGPVMPHTDATQTEHGFVSLLPLGADRLLAVWLDGRRLQGAMESHDGGHAQGSEAMAMRFGVLTPAGEIESQGELDDRTCDCCQTAATAVGDDVIVAWRDRSESEIRDISLRRFSGAGWNETTVVNDDGWRIEACPVNGPALDAEENHVAIAWFTGAGDVPKVNLKMSDDGGHVFGPAIRIDDGRPLGRVDVEVMMDGSSVVLWMEHTDRGAELRLRHVLADGRAGPQWKIAEASAERSSGFPRMTLAMGHLALAWTDADTLGREFVKTALLPVAQLQAGR